MSIKKRPSAFVTNDGMEFEEGVAANRHQNMLDCMDRFRIARSAFLTALACDFKTADGYPLPDGDWVVLYYVDPSETDGSVQEVNVYPHTPIDVGLENGKCFVAFKCLVASDAYSGDRQSYRLDQLFLKKRNAWKKAQSNIQRKIGELTDISAAITRILAATT